MKKVLLLGDSIRMGYDEYVKEILKDEFDVIYDESDNGRFSAYTLWQANQSFKNCGQERYFYRHEQNSGRKNA